MIVVYIPDDVSSTTYDARAIRVAYDQYVKTTTLEEELARLRDWTPAPPRQRNEGSRCQWWSPRAESLPPAPPRHRQAPRRLGLVVRHRSRQVRLYL